MRNLFDHTVEALYAVDADIIDLANNVAPEFRYLQDAKLIAPPVTLNGHYNGGRFPASIECRFIRTKPILAYTEHVNHPEFWVAFPEATFALFMQLGRLGQIPGAPEVDEKMLAAMQKGGAKLGGVERIRFPDNISPKEFYGKVDISAFRPEVKAGEYINAYFEAQFSAWNPGASKAGFTSEKLQHQAHWPLK